MRFGEFIATVLVPLLAACVLWVLVFCVEAWCVMYCVNALAPKLWSAVTFSLTDAMLFSALLYTLRSIILPASMFGKK